MANIQHTTYMKVTTEKVYEAISTEEGWNAWFTDETSIKWNQDGSGEIKLRWTSFGMKNEIIEDGGPILDSKQNEYFIFQWKPGESVTTVTFYLTTYKDGTLVRLIEEGYSQSNLDQIACLRCASGWGEALMMLKMYLEHGIVCKDDIV